MMTRQWMFWWLAVACFVGGLFWPASPNFMVLGSVHSSYIVNYVRILRTIRTHSKLQKSKQTPLDSVYVHRNSWSYYAMDHSITDNQPGKQRKTFSAWPASLIAPITHRGIQDRIPLPAMEWCFRCQNRLRSDMSNGFCQPPLVVAWLGEPSKHPGPERRLILSKLKGLQKKDAGAGKIILPTKTLRCNDWEVFNRKLTFLAPSAKIIFRELRKYSSVHYRPIEVFWIVGLLHSSCAFHPYVLPRPQHGVAVATVQCPTVGHWSHRGSQLSHAVVLPVQIQSSKFFPCFHILTWRGLSCSKFKFLIWTTHVQFEKELQPTERSERIKSGI